MSLVDSIKRRIGKARSQEDEPDGEPRPAAEPRPSEPLPEKAETRKRRLFRFKLSPPRRPGWARIPRLPRAVRVAFAWTVLVLAVVFVVGAGMELVSSGKINPGVKVDGVPVGGKTRAQAQQALENKIKPLDANVQLVFEGKQYPVDLKAIRFRIDMDGMVQEAFESGKRSPGLLRVARRLLGAKTNADIPMMISCDRAQLKSIVNAIAAKVDRHPTSASISIASGEPDIIPSTNGVKVRVDDTIQAVLKALPTEKRQVDLVADLITPELVDSDIAKVIVIHQKTFRLYLYNREEEVNSFMVAVGMPQYPTPNGHFHITYKERNPTWLPTSEWAKDKQGIPQPPGPNNPLGGYWMDIGGGIGIHATPFPKSLGEQASHGCIRMAEDDAAILFNAIKVGTPVFITD